MADVNATPEQNFAFEQEIDELRAEVHGLEIKVQDLDNTVKEKTKENRDQCKYRLL